MKKLLCIAAAALLLAGCGSSTKTTTGEGTSTNDKGLVTTAKVTMEGDKIKTVEIDETFDKEGTTTKKAKGADYNMKGASPIGKEWNEQIEALEKFIADKGIDAVKLDKDGYAENEDVKSSCTINIAGYVEAVNNAVKNAK